MDRTLNPDYQASLQRIQMVGEVLQLLRPDAELELAEPGSDADRKWGIDGWIAGHSFGIATQRGDWPTITITGTRASGYPAIEALIPERIRNGEPYPELTITAYGEAIGPEAPYTSLNAVRMTRTADLHSLPEELWTEKPIYVRAEEGNTFKFVSVADIRAAGYRVWEWDSLTGWTNA